MPDFGPTPDKHVWRCLAVDKVRYVGEGVAVVVAEQPLPRRGRARPRSRSSTSRSTPVVDPEQALADGAPLVHDALGSNVAYERTLRRSATSSGDFAAADVVVKDRLRWHRSGGQPLETVGAIADFDRGTGDDDRSTPTR